MADHGFAGWKKVPSRSGGLKAPKCSCGFVGQPTQADAPDALKSLDDHVSEFDFDDPAFREAIEVTERWSAGMFDFVRVSFPKDVRDGDPLIDWATNNLDRPDWVSYEIDGYEVVFQYEKEA